MQIYQGFQGFTIFCRKIFFRDFFIFLGDSIGIGRDRKKGRRNIGKTKRDRQEDAGEARRKRDTAQIWKTAGPEIQPGEKTDRSKKEDAQKLSEALGSSREEVGGRDNVSHGRLEKLKERKSEKPQRREKEQTQETSHIRRYAPVVRYQGEGLHGGCQLYAI